MTFNGLRVLSFESRRATEIATLIRRQGGDPFVAPALKEKGLDDSAAAVAFVDRLEAGEFDMVIFLTGVGVGFLFDAVAPRMLTERLRNALGKVTVVARGPKPVARLRALEVPITVTIPEPNTWKEVVQAVAARSERRIAVQEYGRPNESLYEALRGLGASVAPLVVYDWELPEDTAPIEEAVRKLVAHEFDVVLFTSSVQLDHLLEIAGRLGKQPEVLQALREDVVIASQGPVMSAALREREIPVHIEPEHPKMGFLLKAASEQAYDFLPRSLPR